MLTKYASKIAVGAVILAVAAIAVVGVAHTPAQAADYVFTRNLTLGSTGADVLALQAYLNMTSCCHVAESGPGSRGNESTYFGELTRAALAKFQASVGITPAVGYFGPLSMGYVNTHGMAMVPNLPAGCTSTAGFSTTSGVKCDTPVGSSLPAGCTSTAGFSPTTGAKCDTGVTPAPTGGGPLHGGAGDITVTEKNSGTDDQILEGDSKGPVLGFEVEPDGSDVSITSARVEFEHTDTTGSDRLERYAQKVYVMMGDQVVGSADTSDFTKNSNVYSRNIPVSSAVVRDNDKTKFWVAVDAEDNVDSNDLGTDWDVALGAVRFEDATGAILTNNDGDGISGGSITNTFTFEDLASAGDIKLTVSESDSSVNDSHSETVSDSSDTNDVDLLSFNIKAKSTDTLINTMSFDVTSSGAGVTEIANDFRLMMGGNEVGNTHLFSGVAAANGDCTGSDVGFGSTSDAAVCIQVTDLDEDDVSISEGSDEDFTLVTDINDTGGAFTSGDSLSASLAADNIDAEDSNGDAIGATDLVGSADSGPIKYISTGVALDKGADDDSALIAATQTTEAKGKFTINFDVQAVEDPVWIALTAASSTSVNPATKGAYYYVESANSDDVAITTSDSNTAILECASDCGDGTLDGNYVKINADGTAHLKLTITFDPAATGDYRGQLYAINFAFSKAAGTDQVLALPTFDYQSPAENVPES